MAEIRIRNQGKITVQDSDSSNEVSLQAPSTVASYQTKNLHYEVQADQQII